MPNRASVRCHIVYRRSGEGRVLRDTFPTKPRPGLVSSLWPSVVTDPFLNHPWSLWPGSRSFLYTWRKQTPEGLCYGPAASGELSTPPQPLQPRVAPHKDILEPLSHQTLGAPRAPAEPVCNSHDHLGTPVPREPQGHFSCDIPGGSSRTLPFPMA